MQLVAQQFGPAAFVGGHAVLDLANTVAGRDPARPYGARGEAPGRDKLPDYAAFVAWGRAGAENAATPLDDAEEMDALERLARRSPARAAEALERLKRLREAVFAIFSSISDGGAAPDAALQELRAAWLEAAGAARLDAGADGYALAWSVARSALDLPRHRAAWQAVELLTSSELARVHRCDGDDCGWLFLDRSKAGRRRWCDMATCGNVAKARRHHARHREG